jgi:hypothetical protein
MIWTEAILDIMAPTSSNKVSMMYLGRLFEQSEIELSLTATGEL